MGVVALLFPERPLSLEKPFLFAELLEEDQDVCPFITTLLHLFGIVDLHLSTLQEAEAISSLTSEDSSDVQHYFCNLNGALIAKELIVRTSTLADPVIEEHTFCGFDGMCHQALQKTREQVALATPPIFQWRNKCTNVSSAEAALFFHKCGACWILLWD